MKEDIPILFMTARDDFAVKQRGYRVDTDDDMVKPIDLDNLFFNAFKFTEPGGKVTGCLTTEENCAIVKVAHTGCGMAPEVGKHIFEKIYQGDISHATRGKIAVQSVWGEGSIFTVRIEKT